MSRANGVVAKLTATDEIARLIGVEFGAVGLLQEGSVFLRRLSNPPANCPVVAPKTLFSRPTNLAALINRGEETYVAKITPLLTEALFMRIVFRLKPILHEAFTVSAREHFIFKFSVTEGAV